jgi:hypothetical protein
MDGAGHFLGHEMNKDLLSSAIEPENKNASLKSPRFFL